MTRLTNPQIKIRRSDASDMAVLLDFLREVDRIESLRGNMPPGQFITDQTTALLESCISFLAIIQSEIIGVASVLVQFQPYAEGQDNNKYALIYLLAVKENWRNQGIGTGLLQSALSWLKDERVSQISLTVKTANEGAMRLYRSFGFDAVAITMKYRIDIEE